MSILNVYVSDQRALIAVDDRTRIHGPLSEPVTCSHRKLITLVHANAVLAVRGELMIFAAVAAGLLAAPRTLVIEDVLQLLPELADDAAAVRPWFTPTEFVAVGWSSSAGKIVGGHCLHACEADRFTMQPLGSMVAPNMGWDSLDRLPPLTNEAGMAALARRQVQLHRESIPEETGIGGRLRVAEVTRGCVSLREVCSLD